MARVVSLVPSATETLVDLGAPPVGCTRFCLQPGIPTVGGTKTPDLAAVEELAPDAVVVNDEENRLEDADALEAAGIRTVSVSPRSVDDVGPAVRELARVAGAAYPVELEADAWPPRPVGHGLEGADARAFVVVWPRPWMTMSADTYGSSLLDLLGVGNVCGDAPDRYPEVDVEEVASRRPDVVLLPTEPFPFGERHVDRVAAVFPGARVGLVDGQDLFWWGTRTPRALERLAGELEALVGA